MFSSAWNFVKRHRRKLIVTGAVIGGGIWLYQYAKKSLVNFQEKEMTEYLNNSRKWQHFDNNQRTCHMTALSLLPALQDRLVSLLNSEELTDVLKTNPPNKVEIWENLKIVVFTRVISAVYAVAVVQLFVRVQLNVISGYIFLDSLPQHAPNSVEVGTTHGYTNADVQKKYLEMVQYLLDQGLTNLVDFVKKETDKNLRSVKLQEKVNFSFIETLVNHVRERVEHHVCNERGGASLSRVLQLMIPATPYSQDYTARPKTQQTDPEKVTHLLLETLDIVDSPDFDTVLTGCLDTGFNHVLDEIAVHFKPVVGADGVMQHPNDVKLPLAKVIPLVNNLVFNLCSGTPNPYVQELALKPQVKDFAANIYEAFSQEQETI